MYYVRLQSSWEELSHYNSFIEWLASAPSENIPIPPTTAEIYAKIVKKTWVFQFLAGLNPDFEYARVHLLGKTSTLEVAHAYYFSNQSRWSPMPPISGIPSETSAMAVRYAYPALPSFPSQTSHTSSPSLSPLPAASGNSRPSRKKYDYCGKWGHLKKTCHALHGHPAGYQPRPSQSSAHLSADSSVYNRRHPGPQPPTPDCQTSSVASGLPPAIDSPLSDHRLSPTCRAFLAPLSLVDIPRTVADALAKPHWKATLLEELHTFEINNTWSLGIMLFLLLVSGPFIYFKRKRTVAASVAGAIYAKIVENTRVLQFFTWLNLDFEYAQVHLLDKTHFPTLEEAHAYCLSDQSRRSPMPPISGIPLETSALAVRYAYLAPPSVLSQTSHTSSPSLSPLPAAFGNSRPPGRSVFIVVSGDI
ncbi:hypothetical protein GIB67_031132 [Kingdonia uniflora]|uniref:Uncharacterized protein n=1 Tax=Kingdonia uniflora TaxID=39325 RepID=A0A7J7MEK9_9MAGN|nr:hypothetical protein GIB67_031132 [Kingdonia uniflora]